MLALRALREMSSLCFPLVSGVAGCADDDHVDFLFDGNLVVSAGAALPAQGLVVDANDELLRRPLYARYLADDLVHAQVGGLAFLDLVVFFVLVVLLLVGFLWLGKDDLNHFALL